MPEFSKDNVMKKSMAAGNLVNWVINTIIYNRIYKNVKPLMDKSKEAGDEAQVKLEELAVVQAKVAVINAKVAELEANLAEAQAKL